MSGSPGSREKILQCAGDLFRQVGYASTSVDDILKRCGVAKSNFYYHFESKEQLGLSVLSEWIDDQERTTLRALRDRERSPIERLERYFDAVREAQSSLHVMIGCPFGNFVGALTVTIGDATMERFRERLSLHFQHTENVLAECLQDAVTVGQIRSDAKPKELATITLATTQGLLILTKTHQSVEHLDRGLSSLLTLIRTQ